MPKPEKHGGGVAAEIAGELANVVFAHSATEKIHHLQPRFEKWIAERHPPGNEDVERAVARSKILADLFCLMEAEPGTLEDHKWLQRAKRICPGALLRTPPLGVLTQAAVSAIGEAKKICGERLRKLEAGFKPAGFDAARLLTEPADGDFGAALANAALAELEKELAEGRKEARLSDRVREVFAKRWFSYLCLAFHSEIKENQRVATIFIAMRQEIGFMHLGDGLNEIREGMKRLTGEPDPCRTYDTTAYFNTLRIETRQIELHELKVERKETPEPNMDALYYPLMTTGHGDERRPAGKKAKIELAGTPAPILLEEALKDRRLIIEGGPGSGKTTFLRRIAWALCREDKGNEGLKLPFDGFRILASEFSGVPGGPGAKESRE
jgi:hypothetical protein